MKPHKKLDIWEEIMKMVEETYQVVSVFPKDETYGLVSQMKKAAVSVASNVAEGCARKGNQEKIQFFMIARGSLSELDAQLEISLRLKFTNENDHQRMEQRLERISRMLQGLIRSRYVQKQNNEETNEQFDN